jgi:hypothetical protein
VLAAEHDGAGDGDLVQQVERLADEAQSAAPGVWPQRQVGRGGLRRAVGGGRARHEPSHFVDAHLESQIAVGDHPAGLLLQRQGQVDQAEAVQAQVSQPLPWLDRQHVRHASNRLPDGVVGGLQRVHADRLGCVRHRQQVAADLAQAGCAREVGLRPPRGAGHALVHGQSSVGAGDDAGQVAAWPGREHIGV